LLTCKQVRANIKNSKFDDGHAKYRSPRVSHIARYHDSFAINCTELGLYFKAGKLIEFLSEWTSVTETVPERMEELWILLYERGYIEIEDVKVVQLWLDALVETGYEFPQISRKRVDNVVLMGQFNYNSNADNVVFWVQKWRQQFGRVEVRGPFDDATLGVLKSRGITAHQGANDKGYYSPIKNLALTLEEHKNSEGIDGVLYLHDDALLDMRELAQGVHPFPSNKIIGSTFEDFFPLSYQDHRMIDDSTALSKSSYSIHKGGGYSKADGTSFTEANTLQRSLQKWWAFKLCIKPSSAANRDSRIDAYRHKDGSFLVPSPTQADMLFVPTSLADEFGKAAEIMLDSKVFLECALATIVQMLQTTTNVTTRQVELCTTWKKSRNSEQMIKSCFAGKGAFGMYHPFKLSIGFKSWARMFDSTVAHSAAEVTA